MKKAQIIKLGIITIVAIIMYINFVTIFYSIDTYKILKLGYDEYGINYSLRDGRPFMAVICMLAYKANISISVFYFINLITSIIISAISVEKIYEIIQKIKPTNNMWVKMILLAISYTYIFNFMCIDNMTYIENIIMSVSVLLYIISAEKLIIKEQKLQALILTVLGVMFYQGSICVWISFCSLLAILKHKKINKKLIKDIFIAAIITIIASTCNYMFINGINKYVEFNQILLSRINFELIENLKYSISKITRLLVDSIDLFPKGVWIGFVIAQSFIMLIYSIKNKEINNFFKLLLVILIYIISGLLLASVYPRAIHGGNGRIFGSIGALVAAIAIYMYCNTHIFESTKWLKKCIVILSILYFVINFGNTIYITNNYSKNNNLDKEYSIELMKKIEEHEEQNNIEITQMAFKYIKAKGERIEKPSNKYGVSYKKTGQYSGDVLKLYTGRAIKRIEFDSEIFDEYFTREEEKIIFIGNTVYFTISYK